MRGGSISLSGVRVLRSGRAILDVDNLQIAPGAFIGILGTNGAGKTTLLKVCCGLIKPNRGKVVFDNESLNSLSSWRKSTLRKRIGYIPQTAEYNADLPFTLREVVSMGRTSVKPLLARLDSEDHEIVDSWIDRLGLADRRNQTFRSLSGGEQQKALIARAMAQEPEVLMLDEPCSDLDFNWRYQITEIVDRLYQQANITVLMVSHETNVLPCCCNRIVLLHEGRILTDGKADDVLASEALERAYKCRVEVVEVDGRKYTIGKGNASNVSL
jgi:iron complex transport system ATP-binding protein